MFALAMANSILCTSVAFNLFYLFQRKSFIKQVRVFPPVKLFKMKLSPHVYRKAVGGAETLCGVILAIIPGKICFLLYSFFILGCFGTLLSKHRLNDLHVLIHNMPLLCKSMISVELYL